MNLFRLRDTGEFVQLLDWTAPHKLLSTQEAMYDWNKCHTEGEGAWYVMYINLSTGVRHSRPCCKLECVTQFKVLRINYRK